VLALVCYSIGVWSERISGRLKPWHLLFFWLGLAFDAAGTGTDGDGRRPDGGHPRRDGCGGDCPDSFTQCGPQPWSLDIMSGLLSFHKFSIVVWVIWLIPFLSGVFLPMAR